MHSLPGSSASKPTSICRHSAIFISLLCLLALALSGCATSRFTAGGEKVSLPLADKRLLEEVHSVAVPPFYHDDNHWRQLALEGLSSTNLTVVAADRVDAAAGATGKDLSIIGPYDRAGALVKLGRSLQADAVLNGLVLPAGDRSELVLQLISTADSRILYWQAVDFSFTGARADPDAQRELMARMLGPLAANTAKREKQSVSPPVSRKTGGAPVAKPDELPSGEQKREGRPKIEKKQKPDRMNRPEPAQPVVPEEISPM